MQYIIKHPTIAKVLGKKTDKGVLTSYLNTFGDGEAILKQLLEDKQIYVHDTPKNTSTSEKKAPTKE